MSKEQLVGLIQEQLDDESDTSSRRERELKTAQKGNRVFAENIGNPVFEYLDTIYLQRVKDYITETFEERIKRLEEKVASLEVRVK